MPFRYKVLIDSLKPISIYFNKKNFEDQMNIYNLCISFILKHDYREMLGRSKAFFNTLIMFYHMKGINNLIQHPSLPSSFIPTFLLSIHQSVIDSWSSNPTTIFSCKLICMFVHIWFQWQYSDPVILVSRWYIIFCISFKLFICTTTSTVFTYFKHTHTCTHVFHQCQFWFHFFF